MIQKLRLSTQLFGAVLAIVLVVRGIYSFNLLFVVSALVVALLAGRFFCGWLCPLGLWTERALKPYSRNRSFPPFLKSKVVAYGSVAFFLGLLYYLPSSGLSSQLWPFLLMGTMFLMATSLGILLSHRAWCSYLCPWGILGGIIGKASYYRVAITGDCKGCRLCEQVCPLDEIPGQAVTEKIQSPGDQVFLSSRCMRCLECAEQCPQGAIDLVKKPTAGHMEAEKSMAG